MLVELACGCGGGAKVKPDGMCWWDELRRSFAAVRVCTGERGWEGEGQVMLVVLWMVMYWSFGRRQGHGDWDPMEECCGLTVAVASAGPQKFFDGAFSGVANPLGLIWRAGYVNRLSSGELPAFALSLPPAAAAMGAFVDRKGSVLDVRSTPTSGLGGESCPEEGDGQVESEDCLVLPVSCWRSWRWVILSMGGKASVRSHARGLKNSST